MVQYNNCLIIYHTVHVGSTSKKKAKASDDLWKIVVAFVVIILLATLAIYFVGSGSAPKGDPKGNDKVVKETGSKSQTKKEEKVPKKKPKDSQSAITNKYDKTIAKQLEDGEKLIKKKDVDRAHRTFEKLVKNHPDSPRAMYGLARSLRELADVKRSNQIMQQAIDTFGKVDEVKECPLALKKLAVIKQAENLAFLGKSRDAAKVLRELSKSLPRDAEVWSKMGVQFLMSGQNGPAKKAFQEVCLWFIRPYMYLNFTVLTIEQCCNNIVTVSWLNNVGDISTLFMLASTIKVVLAW